MESSWSRIDEYVIAIGVDPEDPGTYPYISLVTRSITVERVPGAPREAEIHIQFSDADFGLSEVKRSEHGDVQLIASVALPDADFERYRDFLNWGSALHVWLRWKDDLPQDGQPVRLDHFYISNELQGLGLEPPMG